MSVSNKEEGGGKADVNDLDFIFRGNNLNNIEPISSQRERVFKWACVVACLFYIVIAAMMPLRTTVKYDVMIEGKKISNVQIEYNEYTKKYIVKQKGQPIVKTSEIQNVTVSEQPLISFEVYLTVGLLLFCIFIIVLITRHGKKSLFAALYKLHL